eukprot:TRINITY_DN7082_c0_g1_i1.p1 TRINITY_DN7082_c0_g1~~TRINITY_DN7082_c0_g1_i1.p1  ORF type:complete len:428 (-),score=92.48 TRINITY_DN7082_c0_g1_i1:310-1593(-)
MSDVEPSGVELEGGEVVAVKVPAEPSSKEFFLWFINPGAGGQSGAGILKHLKERYVADPNGEVDGAAYSLSGDPDRPHKPFKPYVPEDPIYGGLYFLWDILDLYADIQRPLRVVVAGGDGTVVWVLNALARHPGMRARLDKDDGEHHQGPVTGVVPLGTGNDMSRFLRWGNGYGSAGDLNFHEFIQDSVAAETYMMDRWKIEMTPPPENTTTFGKGDTSYFCNYFSIGVDGKVAKDFEGCRQSCGSCFCCPCINKLWYAWHGGKCTTACTCTAVQDVATFENTSGDTPLVLTDTIDHDSVVFANIASYSAGIDLWANNSSKYSMPDAHDANDGKLEVIGIDGTQQLGRAQVSTCCAHFDRLSQGNDFQVKIHQPIHMQMDGEAWIVTQEQIDKSETGHVLIHISRDYSMPMLRNVDAQVAKARNSQK